MPFDVHAEDRAGVFTHFIGVLRQFDATGFTTPTDLYLRLDDDGITNLFRRRDGFIDGIGDGTWRHRDAKAGKVLFTLIFE